MSGKQVWRMIDTGIRSAAENMAMNKTLLEGHQEGITPHTLRFLQFTPSVLLGFHQSAEQELRLDYCKENNIEIQRRMTGGGAIYFDETQIGWELYLDKKALGTADMSTIAKKICEAAAQGMSQLGVNAKFRPRNDIEVDGRKISGTGGAFDGDSILYQGTLLVDFDIERMMKTLRIPAEKLSDKAIASARERVVNLKELLGKAPDLGRVKASITEAFAKAFDVQFEAAEDINETEKKQFIENLAEIDTDEWIYQHNASTEYGPIIQSIYKCEGGLMRASISIDTKRNILKQLWLTGDFFVKPKRIVNDLEAALKDCPVDQIKEKINAFFANNESEMLMLEPEHFVTVINMALEQIKVSETA